MVYIYPVGSYKYILWHVLDLLRLGNVVINKIYEFESFGLPLPGGSVPNILTYGCYPASLEFKKYSMEVAKQTVAEARQESQREFMPKLRHLKADGKFIRRYCNTLPLLRMKWLEIQNTRKQVQDYKIFDVKATKKDRETHSSNQVNRLKLHQSTEGWQTHIMTGTRVLVTDSTNCEHEVHLVDVEGMCMHMSCYIYAYMKRTDGEKRE